MAIELLKESASYLINALQDDNHYYDANIIQDLLQYINSLERQKQAIITAFRVHTMRSNSSYNHLEFDALIKSICRDSIL